VAQKELNLGILAHVDAGKTTLTERLLYNAGAIGRLGSVDAGTTQTDTLALEQQRGITIRSAVASFAIGDVHVNLIDTPGHPDFIAEVERVLSVLDGAVLVISAVEGVQPQTRILMRALKRLRVPTLIFVNKIDRAGAGEARVLDAIRERLALSVAAMGTTHARGTRTASFTPFSAGDDGFRARLVEVLTERDEGLLADFVEDESGVAYHRLRTALRAQTQRALVHPVFFGSAITGAGVEEITAAIAELLPCATGDPDASLAATVFKIERGAGGEKIAYVRMFAGTLNVRDRVRFGRGAAGKATALEVFEQGGAVQRPSVSAGAIAKVWGLREVQVGDRLGEPGTAGARHQFPPPTLESVVEAVHRDERASLLVALTQLAEQDPLIDVQHDGERAEVSVSLYGEVQKEVIEATLAAEYGIEVAFRDTTPIYVERPLEIGEAVEILHAETNPYLATIGLRLEPAPDGTGVHFRMDVDTRVVPLYVYKTRESFEQHMEEYVREALGQGLFGWQVTDCLVTMTKCEYAIPDGPPSKRGRSTSADFKKLTPIVLAQALERAGTVVCEPFVHGRLEVPTESLGAVVPALGRLGAAVEASTPQGELSVVEALVPVARAHEVQRQLPGLTGGEGVLDSTFAGYQPVSAEPPRRRTAKSERPA
jgi:ribosomal protection tetracycline resistance protein